MSQPDYSLWWNKEDITEDEISTLIFGVDPKKYERRVILGSKPDRTAEEEKEWDTLREEIADTCPDIHGAREHIINKKFWNGDKEAFVHSIYLNGTRPYSDIHPDFYAFLASINIHLNYNPYVDHSQFKENLKDRALDTIDTEDKALILLLGLKAGFLQKFWNLLETRKSGEPWANQDDQFFEREYFSFMMKEFPTFGFPYALIKLFCDRAKEHSLWNGDFKVYVEALHDEGFLFKPEVYDELKEHNIELVYTPNGWARTFYKQWIDNQGVWKLKDAANLYLGNDPNGGQGFTGMYGSESKTVTRHGQGILLSDSETIFLLNDNGEWKLPLSRLENTSLEYFIRRHIAGENLQPASTDGLEEGLYFKPKEIIEFFQSRFLNVPPKALLIELDIEARTDEQAHANQNMTHTGLPGRPSNSKHLLEQEFERRKTAGTVADTLAGEVRVLLSWLEQNHPNAPQPAEGTTQNNFREAYRQYTATKQTA